MVSSISDIFYELDFYSIHQVFLDSNYYSILFPFLLFYALLSTVLGKIKIFQDKKTKQPKKSIIVIISLIVSFFGVSFETSPGYTVGDLLMVMFPNISALTIGILCLYIVGSMFGKDFFKGVFKKDHGAYLYLTIGVIGLGSVIFYVGIAMGFWDMNPLDIESQWNVIFAVALLIMGILFLFIDLAAIGVLFLLVFFAYAFNYGEGNILSYFIDPIVFIIVIVISLISWMNTDAEKKDELDRDISSSKRNMEEYEKLGVKDSVIKDIIEENLKRNQEKRSKFK